MKSDGKTQEAIDSLQAWLQEQSKNIDQETSASRLALLQLQTGRALASLGAEAEGEVLMRSAVELDANVSLDYVQAMTQLSDSAARKAAVEFLLARALQTEDPQTARMLAGLISIGATDQDLLDQVEPVLEQIYAANADNQDLLLAMADMWLSQNKQEKAIEIYKRVIRINPNDVVALNNLANLLADQPGAGQEALQYIEQALRIAGNDPLLLDTKGMIQLNNGQIDDAIPTLRSAATASQDPRLAFHLWTALRQGDRLAEANAVRRMLKIDELKTSLLTPADQRELLELENTMEKAQ
jgi:tetratricopeptide (TPR) repeat protein